MDGSKLGAVICQNNKPIAIYSRKLNPEQVSYTTIERELFSILEILKKLSKIFLGQQIKVFSDHKNLTYITSNTERVMRWRLILEELILELIYTKGSKNIAPDALSSLNIVNKLNSSYNRKNNKEEPTLESLSENFALN